jgi:hypothetical protein
VYGFIGHDGGLPGFTTDAWYLPALQATIVVIVNSDAQAALKPGTYEGVGPADHLSQQLVKIVSGLWRAARAHA